MISTSRNFPDWIDTFVESTESVVSPEIFRRWAGVASIAATLRRASFTFIQGQKVYPCLYTMFVATPGVGKSNAIKHARAILSKVPKISLSPQSIASEAALYEVLEIAGQESSQGTEEWTENINCCVAAFIDEYGTLIKGDNLSFMDALTDLYDCPAVFTHKTKTAGENVIENPCLNLLGGCTPTWLRDSFTDAALERGFASRMVLVHSDERIMRPLFGGSVLSDSTTEDALSKDLAAIYTTAGEFKWSPAAAKIFSSWYDDGMNPQPADPRLANYNTRRVVHISKLSLIHRVSRGPGTIIEEEDFSRAKAMLLYTEERMPKAVESLGTNPHYAQVRLIQALIMAWWIKNQSAMPEHELRARIARDVPSAYTETLINSVILAGGARAAGDPGKRMFLPPEREKSERGAPIARAMKRPSALDQEL